MFFSCKFPYCTKIFNKYALKQKRKQKLNVLSQHSYPMGDSTMTINDKHFMTYVVATKNANYKSSISYVTQNTQG